jgi:hypothetical protein
MVAPTFPGNFGSNINCMQHLVTAVAIASEVGKYPAKSMTCQCFFARGEYEIPGVCLDIHDRNGYINYTLVNHQI